jgi:hypothetical protein
MVRKKKKTELLKTVKSKYWYWKGSDIFGEGRKTIEQKTFENK